jgi:hypothetical protein
MPPSKHRSRAKSNAIKVGRDIGPNASDPLPTGPSDRYVPAHAPEPDQSRMPVQPSTALRELFRWYAVPPSPLHDAVQTAARREGWVPPWDREDQLTKKKVAGKKSAVSRAGRTSIRRSLVWAARERLAPQYWVNPYSDDAIDMLKSEFRKLLHEDVNNSDIVVSAMLAVLSDADRAALNKTARETLIKDVKALGFRSKRNKSRSGSRTPFRAKTPSNLFPR